MKLNGMTCTSYVDKNAYEAEFVLSGATLSEALALDGQTLTMTTESGTEYRVWQGYSVTGVELDEREDGLVHMHAARALDAQTSEAIAGLEGNVQSLYAAQSETSAAVESLEGATTGVAQASAAAAIYVNGSTTLTDSQLADVRDLIDDFKAGGEYAKGAIRRYAGSYYRMAQGIDSTTSTTYQPGEGTESLYTLIDLAADGIRVWHAPTGATDSFALGEKAHYPDADGPVYVSGRDGNTSEPTEDEWWELDQAEAE